MKELGKKQLKTISSSPLFEGLGAEETEQALRILEAETEAFSKGELIHAPACEMNKSGLVLEGIVQVCMDDSHGHRSIMATVEKGVTFGESLCFLGIRESPVSVYAGENAVILWLKPQKLRTGNDPFTVMLLQRFTSLLAGRALSMNDRIQVLSKLHLRDKLLTYFRMTALKSGSDTFTIPMNREDLAAYMGTNRSALSRELSRMKEDGLISFRKNTFTLTEDDGQNGI